MEAKQPRWIGVRVIFGIYGVFGRAYCFNWVGGAIFFCDIYYHFVVGGWEYLGIVDAWD